MKTIFKTNFNPIERVFISLSMILLVLHFHFPRVNSLNPLNACTADIQKFNVDTKSIINVTLIGMEIEYDVFNEYDFFVPEVDVVCQCGCTNERQEICRPIDRECAVLVNSTTTCTNHITVDSDSSICSKHYKLCCQVYFTKAKMIKPFKAFNLKYNQTLLTFEITSKLSELTTYNVTIPENMKNLLLSSDKVLQVSKFNPVNRIPDHWYFMEDGSHELLYSDDINAIDEVKMNKIGWFQYNDKKKELSRLSTWDLEKRLKVKLLDCHSNPPRYEWKLDATHFISKGLLHLPKNVEKVSDMHKDISKISINLIEVKVKMKTVHHLSIKSNLLRATSFPFTFTSSIKENVLHLLFTNGNGKFHVEIISSHWTDVISFSASFPEKLISLPSLNNDLCWVCVSQNGQQLCQIPNRVKNDITSFTSSTVGLNTMSPMELSSNHKLKNETDFRNDFVSTKSCNTITVLATILAFILLVTSFALFIYLRRYRRKFKTSNTCDDIKLEDSNGNFLDSFQGKYSQLK